MTLPRLRGDFSLVPIEERVRWRDALARHLVEQLALHDTPAWKREEAAQPMRVAAALMLERGVRRLTDITDRLRGQEPATTRNDYAGGE